MCRSIKRLREGPEVFDRSAMEEAALQYVRKVSGFREPSQANQPVFAAAVGRVADATEDLLNNLTIRA